MSDGMAFLVMYASMLLAMHWLQWLARNRDSEVRSLFAPDVATTKEREKSNSAYSASRSGCAFTGVA